MVDPRMVTEAHYAVPDANESVIVTLGDSFTAGSPVASEDSYPRVLSRLLRDAHWPAHVINMGVGNSGPDQHLRLLTDYVLPRVRPEVVVWTLYSNDVYDNVRFAAYDVQDGRLVPLDCAWHWTYVRQAVYDWLPLPHALKKRSAVVRALMKSIEAIGATQVDAEGERRAAAKLALEIQEMDRLAAEHGFMILYVLIAPQSVYLAARGGGAQDWASSCSTRYFETIARILGSREDLVLIDFHERNAESEVFAGADRDRNGLGDRHFNETGYRMLAEIVAERLLIARNNRVRRELAPASAGSIR